MTTSGFLTRLQNPDFLARPNYNYFCFLHTISVFSYFAKWQQSRIWSQYCACSFRNQIYKIFNCQVAKQDNLKQNKRSHNIKIFKKKLQKICHFTNFYSSCCQTLPTGHKKKTLIKCTSNSLLCLYKMRSQQFCNSEASEGVDIKEFFQLLVTYYFPLVRRILHKAIGNLTSVLANMNNTQ